MEHLSIEYLQTSKSKSEAFNTIISAYEKTEKYELQLIDQVVEYIISVSPNHLVMKFTLDILACYHPHTARSVIECCVCAHCTGCNDCYNNFKQHIKTCYTRKNRLLLLYAVGIQMHPAPIARYALEWCIRQNPVPFHNNQIPYLELLLVEELPLMNFYVVYSYYMYGDLVHPTHDDRTYIITLIGNIIRDQSYNNLYHYLVSLHRERPNELTELIGCDITRSISALFSMINFELNDTGSLRNLTQLLYEGSYQYMCKINGLD